MMLSQRRATPQKSHLRFPREHLTKQPPSPVHQPHLYAAIRSFLGSAGLEMMFTHETVTFFLICTASLIARTVHSAHKDEAQWYVGKAACRSTLRYHRGLQVVLLFSLPLKRKEKCGIVRK